MMINRRKVMGYLGAMFGAGVTGAQAAPTADQSMFSGFPGFMTKEPKPFSLFNAATMTEHIEELLEKLGEPEHAGKSACITNYAIAEGWGGDVHRMLADLAVPTYEHRVFYCVSTENVLVERPAADGSYWADESRIWKRLR